MVLQQKSMVFIGKRCQNLYIRSRHAYSVAPPHMGAPTDLVALRALTALTRKKIIPRKFPLLKVFRWR